MTLTERIRKAEAMGFCLVGFYVAPDVFRRIASMLPGQEQERLGALLGRSCDGLDLHQDAHLPPGCVAPKFDCPPGQHPWPLALPPIGGDWREVTMLLGARWAKTYPLTTSVALILPSREGDATSPPMTLKLADDALNASPPSNSEETK